MLTESFLQIMLFSYLMPSPTKAITESTNVLLIPLVDKILLDYYESHDKLCLESILPLST